jgi:hypothetical protein
MRRNLLLIASVCLLGAAPARAAEPDAYAKAMLDKAVKAMGGADKLAKLPATTLKSKGALIFNDQRFEYADEWEFQSPDRFRWNLTIRLNDNKEVPLVFGLTEKTSWRQAGTGKAVDRSEDESRMLRVDCRAVLLAHYPPALQEKGTELMSLGELKINDRPAVGLKVSRKGWPDVDLFFDKETHLPVKLETRFKETKDGPDVAHSFTFGEYKEADGVKYFSRVKLHRDETLISDMEVTELKRLDKIDDGRFAKP